MIVLCQGVEPSLVDNVLLALIEAVCLIVLL